MRNLLFESTTVVSKKQNKTKQKNQTHLSNLMMKNPKQLHLSGQCHAIQSSIWLGSAGIITEELTWANEILEVLDGSLTVCSCKDWGFAVEKGPSS